MTEETKPKSKLEQMTIKVKGVKPPMMLLYGVEGCGKSTFGASLPKPFFLRTEDGTVGDGFEGLPTLPLCTSWASVKEGLAMLREDPHEYKSIVIDTVDGVERLIHEKIAIDNKVSDIAKIDFHKGYDLALEYVSEFLNICYAIREERKMIICLLGHQKIYRFDPPDSQAFNRYRVNMHDKAALLVEGKVDHVFFVATETRIKNEGEHFGKTIYKGLGNGERILKTEMRPAHHAKNRANLPYEMPFTKTVWQNMREYMLKKKD